MAQRICRSGMEEAIATNDSRTHRRPRSRPIEKRRSPHASSRSRSQFCPYVSSAVRDRDTRRRKLAISRSRILPVPVIRASDAASSTKWHHSFRGTGDKKRRLKALRTTNRVTNISKDAEDKDVSQIGFEGGTNVPRRHSLVEDWFLGSVLMKVARSSQRPLEMG